MQNSTLVTFELTAKGTNETRLRVFESGFNNLLQELREMSHRENTQGWQVELGELVEFLNGATP